MAPHDIALPDAKLHIAKLAKPFQKLEGDARLEIRALKEGERGMLSVSQRFDPSNQLSYDNALKFAQRHNSEEYNIYITVNPLISKGSPFSAAKDTEVQAATYLFLDADDPSVAEELLREVELEYDFIVVTGTIPHLRIHLYFELEEPHFNLKDWEDQLHTMIVCHNCDLKPKNPSRIMRLAGFFSHPSRGKAEKGYVPELVKLYDREDTYDFL